MRGNNDEQQAMMFVVSMEAMVPAQHPIRAIKKLVDAELARLDCRFNRMYSKAGRPSIPPERLLKAMLLMALFTPKSLRIMVFKPQANEPFHGTSLVYAAGSWWINLQIGKHCILT